MGRKSLIIAFSLFTSHLICSEEQINIPVIPENKNERILNKSEIINQNSIDSVDDPAFKNANQEIVNKNIVPGSSASQKSFADIANKISSAQVEHYGGEAGALRVRLRGSRAFEPSYYFNGLPLTGGSSGEQNLSLLPFSFVALLNVYPDAPPFWLNALGTGGDIDIKTCRRKECFTFADSADSQLIKVTTGAGSFGYRQALANYSLKINKKYELFATAEVTASKEDYPVFNNHNSVLHPEVGTYENLQNNDFQKVTAGIGYSAFYEPLGKISFDGAFGGEERGIPGPVGTISQQRLKRSLFIGTLRSEKIFAANGLQWNNQIGSLFNSAQINNLTGAFSSETNTSKSYSLQAKTWFILPSKIISEEQSGLSVEVLQQKQNTTTAVPANSGHQNNGQIEALRTEFRPALFEALIFPLRENFSLSADAQGWVSYAQASSTMASSSFSKNEIPISGYTFSLQSKYDMLVNFIRYVQTTRRPYLSELYGAPGGVSANSELQAESSKKIETGINLPFVETGYFYGWDHNLIFLQQTSPVTSQYQNIEEGYRHAVYLNSTFNIIKHWNANFSYQYLIARMLRSDITTEVPRSPHHYFSGSTSLEKIAVGHLLQYQSEFGSYVNMTYESPFYLDYANLTQMQIPPLYNTGIAISFTEQKKSQNYIISLDIYNIFNETFSAIYGTNGFVQRVQSNGYLGYPPPGRRIYLSVTGEF